MRFPMLCNWVTVRRNGKKYEITNELMDNKFTTTEYGDDAYIKYITSLDGKIDYRFNSLYSPQVSETIINELRYYGLIREDRWLSKSLSFIAYA